MYYIKSKLKQITNIQEMFLFQIDKTIESSANSQIGNPIPLNIRYDRFYFENEPEEFFSTIPTANLILHKVSDERFVGIIRILDYFIRFVYFNFDYPLFGLDTEGRLIGFNRAFAQNISKSSESLLGRPIGDLISNPPASFQEASHKDFKLPDEQEWAVHLLKDFAKANEPLDINILGDSIKRIATGIVLSNPDHHPYLLFSLNTSIDWMKQDFCLTFKVSATNRLPPSIAMGERPLGREDWGDFNGYILGPDENGKGYLIKRQTIPVYYQKTDTANFGDGLYSIYKINNTFLIYKNGQRVFAYTDIQEINRNETWISFWSFPNQSCLLEQIKLCVRQNKRSEDKEILFSSFIENTSSHFLLSTIGGFFLDFMQQYLYFYKLQGITNIKKKLDILESTKQQETQKAYQANLLLQGYRDSSHTLIGTSKSIVQIRSQAGKIAKADATVLISGETGTGKEVLAHFIHDLSNRKKGAFVKVDCSTLPISLMESLLFGHEKGAFTGADKSKPGLFQEAHNGTLFLDEAGNLSLPAQAKLLQFLQDHSITPIGGQKSVSLNVKVLVASNISLEVLVRQGIFREDLYYRIAVVTLKIPPLRERLDDIPDLCTHFIYNFNVRNNRNIKGLTPEAFEKLYSYSWPGNVRELKNTIERSCLFCGMEMLGVDDIQFQSSPKEPKQSVGRIELSLEEVLELFKKHRGIVKRIAADLNVSRHAVYDFFAKHQIEPNKIRKNPRRNKKG